MNELMPILEKGDEIRIISSARKISRSELNPALVFFRKQGFNPTLGKNIFKEEHQFAGSDQERLEDLQNAINDPHLKVIWMARGGYGTHRVIKELDISPLLKKPKWIIGYSDVSVLHCLLNANNIRSLHATMPVNFKDQGPDSFIKALEVLKGNYPEYKIKAHPLNKNGKAKGKLYGGNLSILYSLNGSEILPIMKDAILFFEDLDEYLYHIDRIMQNFSLSGILNEIKGLIIGGLSDMNDNLVPYGKTAEEIVFEHVNSLEIPVCFGFPAGHQKENFPLLLGEEILLNVDNDHTIITY
jgi:muramoyltetrapeptide carboxypeptidase